MKTNEIARTRTHTLAQAAPTIGHRLSATFMVGFFSTSILIGLWSVAAMVGGLITAGGPAPLARGFAQAVLGL